MREERNIKESDARGCVGIGHGGSLIWQGVFYEIFSTSAMQVQCLRSTDGSYTDFGSHCNIWKQCWCETTGYTVPRLNPIHINGLLVRGWIAHDCTALIIGLWRQRWTDLEHFHPEVAGRHRRGATNITGFGGGGRV